VRRGGGARRGEDAHVFAWICLLCAMLAQGAGRPRRREPQQCDAPSSLRACRGRTGAVRCRRLPRRCLRPALSGHLDSSMSFTRTRERPPVPLRQVRRPQDRSRPTRSRPSPLNRPEARKRINQRPSANCDHLGRPGRRHGRQCRAADGAGDFFSVGGDVKAMSTVRAATCWKKAKCTTR
jgi:hypothetical protein